VTFFLLIGYIDEFNSLIVQLTNFYQCYFFTKKEEK